MLARLRPLRERNGRQTQKGATERLTNATSAADDRLMASRARGIRERGLNDFRRTKEDVALAELNLYSLNRT